MKTQAKFNRLGETAEEALENIKKERDLIIPLRKPIKILFKPDWLAGEKKRRKRSWKFELANKTGMPMFKGNFPNILKEYNKNFQKITKSFS